MIDINAWVVEIDSPIGRLDINYASMLVAKLCDLKVSVVIQTSVRNLRRKQSNLWPKSSYEKSKKSLAVKWEAKSSR